MQIAKETWPAATDKTRAKMHEKEHKQKVAIEDRKSCLKTNHKMEALFLHLYETAHGPISVRPHVKTLDAIGEPQYTLTPPNATDLYIFMS